LRKQAKIPGGQLQLFWDESHVSRAAGRLASRASHTRSL
jgi:hypothetical protein